MTQYRNILFQVWDPARIPACLGTHPPADDYRATNRHRFILADYLKILVDRFPQVFAIVFLTAIATASAATSDESSVCDQAARIASQKFDVPLNILRAITRVETGIDRGGQFQPWPWTVNMEGTGRWFETQDLARAYVFKHFKLGARSFDVGCFQINYRWHSQNFRSIDEMFDPVTNAEYAASFLSTLYREFGDWSKAAGAFHSRTPEFAARYSTRFSQILAKLKPGDTNILNSKETFLAMRGSLLPGGRKRNASLVSLPPNSTARNGLAFFENGS